MQLSWQVLSFRATKGTGTAKAKTIVKLDDLCQSTIKKLEEKNADLGKVAQWYTRRWDEMGAAETDIPQGERKLDPESEHSPTPYERTMTAKHAAREGLDSLEVHK
ncbi:uncharacterized protein LOC131931294 [Physella acuta]|uniref:uncharacterized protein LOC131931294 n=1 Tax=Physella acuta TaxID=109671 RepID=UPI0027DB7D06|nr:uncharacterized protein LOC131931294 [Physella acuta]